MRFNVTATGISLPTVIVLLTLAVAPVGAVEVIPYLTGFETPAFAVGDLDGQQSWTVSEGTAEVQTATVARGGQAVMSAEGSVFDVALDGSDTVLWVDAFLQTEGSADTATIPAEARSSVLFFSSDSGILALDGDGAGGGAYSTVVGAFPTAEFIRVSIRQDYSAKTYDVWINGVEFATGLGFKDNSISKLNGAQRRSATESYLDDFSVTVEGLGADTDNDGLIDLDEVKFYGTDPLLEDTDGDGMKDGSEVFAGTDPTDRASYFAVDVEPADGGARITMPTVTGRVYTLQRKDGPTDGTWGDVPEFVDVPGDDTEQGYTDTEAVGERIYRGEVNQQP